MKDLTAWINDRTGLDSGWRQVAEMPLAGKASWCRTLPAAIAFAFFVQVVSGFFIWMYYSPSTQTAWESVYYLQFQVFGGWLLRAVHHYAAQVLLGLTLLHLLSLIFSGRYRAPREAIYGIGLLLVLCALASMLTGDLLAWTQNGYASTKVRTNFSMLIRAPFAYAIFSRAYRTFRRRILSAPGWAVHFRTSCGAHARRAVVEQHTFLACPSMEKRCRMSRRRSLDFVPGIHARL
jgi:quinol-cytochrome oxidoreductase complex cytochrome b subunit